MALSWWKYGNNGNFQWVNIKHKKIAVLLNHVSVPTKPAYKHVTTFYYAHFCMLERKKVNVSRGRGGALMPAATCKVLRVRWEIYSKSMSIWNGIKHRVKINILHLIKHVVYEYDSKGNTSKCINGLRIRQAKEAKPFERFMWYMSQNRVHNRAPSTLYTSNWNVCSYFRHSSIALLTHIRLTVTFCRSTRLNSILLFMKRAHKQNALHSATLILPLSLVPFSRSFYYYPKFWKCK